LTNFQNQNFVLIMAASFLLCGMFVLPYCFNCYDYFVIGETLEVMPQ